ncbi:hypothetical protein ACFVDI_03010 [Nocardioides sp. NPDC057767]|uniref:hypothetical protein n=1 Tax=unclassified Nocardioides TaxID=2615069 RepID=UPI0036730BFF
MKLIRIAAAAPLAAALIAGGALASSASASTEEGGWEYTGRDFYWQDDCAAAGQQMWFDGQIEKWRCDGSESPFDDYSLFVVWR